MKVRQTKAQSSWQRLNQPQTFTAHDVAAHSSLDQGVWLIVDGGVYDV